MLTQVEKIRVKGELSRLSAVFVRLVVGPPRQEYTKGAGRANLVFVKIFWHTRQFFASKGEMCALYFDLTVKEKCPGMKKNFFSTWRWENVNNSAKGLRRRSPKSFRNVKKGRKMTCDRTQVWEKIIKGVDSGPAEKVKLSRWTPPGLGYPTLSGRGEGSVNTL